MIILCISGLKSILLYEFKLQLSDPKTAKSVCVLPTNAQPPSLTGECLPVPVQARHTGIKIVQQIAILLGCGVLPHLKALVDIVKHGLTDENQKVKIV